MYAIADEVNAGTLRELFFVNQVRNASTIHPQLIESTVELSAQGDFVVTPWKTDSISGACQGGKEEATQAYATVRRGADDAANAGRRLKADSFTFEIGGKGKNFKQIGGVTDGFVVADDIEVGFRNKLPLWVFGFMY